MRRIVVALWGAFLAVLGAASAMAEEPQLGAVYRTAVKLTDNMSGVWLPLPEGEWKLIGLGRTTNRENTPFLNGRLVALPLDPLRRPRAFVTFSVALQPAPNGWAMPPLCTRKDLHYLEPADPRASNAGGQIRCWGILPSAMRPAENADRWLLDAYKWVGENTRGMPLSTMTVAYQRGSGVKFLAAAYMFNPETQAFRPLGTMNWDRARIAADRKQTRYVERLRAFGVAWEPVFEKGFAGKPLAESDVALAANVDPFNSKGYPMGLVDGEPNPAISVVNVAAISFIGDSGRKGYDDFLKKSKPRAFAVSESGAWGRANGYKGTVSFERALANCRDKTNSVCTLYAINDDVVWPR